MNKLPTLCILICFSLSFSQEKYAKYNQTVSSVESNMILKVIPVKNDIYMIEGLGAGMGNIGLFETDDGVIMIDNSFEIIEDMITEAVREVSVKPIKYIINTHYHYDHADGNRAYGSQNIPIIAHHNVRDRQKKETKAYGGIYTALDNFYVPKHEENELPTLTFEKEFSLHESKEEISIYYFGNGHTDGDAIIKFQNSNVVHTGDSFVLYGLPFIDISNGGSIKGFISNLEMIDSVCDENTIIIPGHGGLSDQSQVQKLHEGLAEYYSKTMTGYQNGLSIDQLVETIETSLGNTSGFGDPVQVKRNFIKSILLENNIIVE